MDGFMRFREEASWQTIAAAFGVYLVTLAFYRLILHPLARFPGPKLAAITRCYEAYYDIIRNGQYTFKIVDLHKKYGKFQTHKYFLDIRVIVCFGPRSPLTSFLS